MCVYMHTSVWSLHFVLMTFDDFDGVSAVKPLHCLSLKVISILALCKSKFIEVNALVLSVVVCITAFSEAASQSLFSLF